MRVSKHGCDVKMFCFSRANHASTNLKKFSSSKLDKFTLFTHSWWSIPHPRKEERDNFPPPSSCAVTLVTHVTLVTQVTQQQQQVYLVLPFLRMVQPIEIQ